MENNMGNINGLLIPMKDEAKQMIDQYSGKDGTSNKIQPLSYDLRLAVKKGLCTWWSKFGDKYLNMQALYRKTLEHYLSEQLNLQMYDDMLANSKLRFLPIEEREKNFYQKYSTFGFKYIYLRNNLPIERLNKTDLNVLDKYIKSNKTDVTDELLELVAKTYHDVIIAKYNQELDTPIGYSNNGQKIAPNDALVFEIRHAAEYDGDGKIVNGKNERMKKEYLKSEFIPLMAENLSEKLDSKVVIFLY